MKYPNKKMLCLIFLLSAPAVFAAKSKIKFKADSMGGSVAENKSTTNLEGNAIVTVDTMEIKADKIEIYGKDYRYLKASGSVKGEDKDKGFSFSGDAMQYDRTLELALFFGKTELNDTKNDVKISAEHIEYNQKAETMLMQFNVKILQKDIACESMFALYKRESSLLDLTGRPTVKKKDDIFKAAKISVNLNTEDISLEGKVSGSVTEQKETKETKTTDKNGTTPEKGTDSAKPASGEASTAAPLPSIIKEETEAGGSKDNGSSQTGGGKNDKDKKDETGKTKEPKDGNGNAEVEKPAPK